MVTKQFQEDLKSTARVIREGRHIILACHLNPDGDAIGSLLGLGFGLAKMGKRIVMLCPDRIPMRYIDLPGARLIKQNFNKQADLAVSVDCASINQLSRLEAAFSKTKRIVEIDHHSYRTRFGDVQLVNKNACSVGEIVLLLLEELGVPLDRKIAECLLTSIIVETSSFSRPDVNIYTFEICAKLMEAGANFRKIAEKFYWQKRLAAVQLTGLALARVRTIAKNKLAWSIITNKDFEHFHGHQEDVDSVADDMMAVADTKITILFREIEGNMLRVSIRSKEGIDVGYLASTYGGGGHPDVAGCRIHNNKKTIEKFVIQAAQLIYKKMRIPKHKRDLDFSI